jgi:hypothetical protein
MRSAASRERTDLISGALYKQLAYNPIDSFERLSMMVHYALAIAVRSHLSGAPGRWIASSRSLSSGAHSRGPLAPRNDGRYHSLNLL